MPSSSSSSSSHEFFRYCPVLFIYLHTRIGRHKRRWMVAIMPCTVLFYSLFISVTIVHSVWLHSENSTEHACTRHLNNANNFKQISKKRIWFFFCLFICLYAYVQRIRMHSYYVHVHTPHTRPDTRSQKEISPQLFGVLDE